MKLFLCVFVLSVVIASVSRAQPAAAVAKAETVVLDEVAVRNLRLKTEPVEERDFEQTGFALGRIEAKPGSVAAVSSRIAGRVVSLAAFPGDVVSAGADVAKLESRQPGNPPPQISLAAPIGGLVTQLDVRLGDPVEPEKALMEITDLSEVHAVARVPEHLAAKLQIGALARISVPAIEGGNSEGRLLRFGTAADAQAGTIDAIFVLKNPGNRLRPGMRAEFSLVLARRAGVVAVPRGALQGEAAKRFVYVKHFDLPHTFVKAPVVIGETNDRFAEIVSGLFPADEVVTEGGYSLAFAGGGSLSLKEALDAAHGHAHNEDGSEITAEQKRAKTETASHDDGHGHSHGEHDDAENPLWMIVSGVLLVLLVVVSFWKRRPAATERPSGGKGN